MSNYTKATNFTAKDGLPAGNSSKVVKGAELDTEFAAISAAIASKADSNSPTFTGTPLAPTASAGTSNTQIATTAFANAAIIAERAATATLTNKTLTSPTIVSPTITNTGTLTLPTSTDTLVGRATTDTLTNKSLALGSNTVTGTKTQFNTAVTDTDFSFLNDFTGSNQSLTSNGYQKFPGGFTVQWGTFFQASGTGGFTDVTFPTAFSSACVYAHAERVIPSDVSGADTNAAIRSLSNTTVSFSALAGYTYYWIAIGY